MRDMKKTLALLLCVLMLIGVWGAAENAGEEAHIHPSPSLSDEVFPTDIEVALQMAAGELSADPRANTDCEHPADALQEYYDFEYVFDGGDYMIVSYDETTHTRRYMQVEWTQCTLCGALVSANTEFVDRVESHILEGSEECTVCDYVMTTQTIHVWPEVGDTEHWYSQEDYSFLNAQSHQKIVTDTLYCTECFDYLSETVRVVGEEPHTFTDGVCVCGYREDGGFGVPSETCQHTNVFESPVLLSNGKKTPIDENYHSVELERIAYDIICLDCGAIVGHKDDYTSGHTYKEPHFFSTKTETGAMCDCGCEIFCPHENAVRDTWNEQVYENTYVDAGDGTHAYVARFTPRYTCPDCGLEWYGDDCVETLYAEHYTWRGDGICVLCGAQFEEEPVEPAEPLCEHKNGFVQGERDMAEMAYSIDEKQHATRHYKLYFWECPDCGKTWDESDTRGYLVYGDHTFEEGFCTECGYLDPDYCFHENTTKTREELPAVYAAVDDETHTRRVDVTVTVTCDDCGKVVSEETEQGEPASEAHAYEDGVCAACGHACAHAETTYGEPQATTEYKATDAAHTATTTTVTLWTCDFCGETGEETAVETAEAAAHTYAPDGEDAYKCSVCGHVCAHEGAAETEAAGETLYADLTDGTHTLVKTTVVTTDCPHCPLVREEIKEEKGEPEAHSYETTEAGSVCKVCGYACTHAETEMSEEIALDHYDEARSTDETHVAVGEKTTVETCASCGAVVAENAQPYSEEMPHTYVDGVCAECGHACSHAGHELPEETFIPTAYASNGADGHTVTGDVHIIVHCDLCGTQLSNTVAEEGVTRAEAHAFSGNKCRLCGYARPVEEAPEEDVVSDEPIFTPVAAEETVHGISAAQGERMAAALTAAVEDIHAQYGDEAEVTVLHCDAILTGTEMQALRALEPAEQILVLLNAIGYENEVSYALNAAETGFSAEADALIEAIVARLAAMTEEERAAFEALLQQYFPMTKLTRESQEYDYVEFTLEIRVRLEDGYRLERYGFRLTDGVWTLASIAVAGADL